MSVILPGLSLNQVSPNNSLNCSYISLVVIASKTFWWIAWNCFYQYAFFFSYCNAGRYINELWKQHWIFLLNCVASVLYSVCHQTPQKFPFKLLCSLSCARKPCFETLVVLVACIAIVGGNAAHTITVWMMLQMFNRWLFLKMNLYFFTTFFHLW